MLRPIKPTKVCTACGEEKPRSMFYKRNNDPSSARVQARCIPCSLAYVHTYRQANRLKVYAKSREWVLRNKEQVNESHKRRYHNANPEQVKHRKETNKQWRQRNADRKAETARRWYEQNREITIQRAAVWASDNEARVRVIKSQNKARRHKRTREQMPSWANVNVINFLYATRVWISEETGKCWHVDHVVPLMNRKVCGLHVHNNLRIVPAQENLKKSNRLLEELI